MEDNVALDSSKQKKFVKSIKGIKKLIKKNAQKEAVEKSSVTNKSKVEVKERKTFKKKRFPRGLVYLSHIPHGFYEHQMTEYFKQFGVVTNARVIRSKRTGRSKGFAFVEFKEPSVAQIVAETMNNYLMGKRLIKAAYIPPEKQRRNAMRKNWNAINNPGNILRMEMKKNFNANKDEEGELKRARKLLSNLNKTKKKLKEIGVNYDFFTPVDIPEAILKNMIKIEKVKEEETIQVKDEDVTTKKNKKTKAEDSKVKVNKVDSEIIKKKSKLKTDEINMKEKSKVKNTGNKKVEKQKKGEVQEQKLEQVPEVNKKQQKDKEDKLNDSGIKPMGDFIKIGQDSDDSDSSVEFDSDEYERVMGSDDEFDSDDHSDGSEGDEDIKDNDSESEEEESVVILSTAKKGVGNSIQNKPEDKGQNKRRNKRNKKKSEIKTQNNPDFKILNKTDVKQQQQSNKNKNEKQNKNIKRKMAENLTGTPKKPKFEKQKNQKQMKKQIKVKK